MPVSVFAKINRHLSDYEYEDNATDSALQFCLKRTLYGLGHTMYGSGHTCTDQGTLG